MFTEEVDGCHTVGQATSVWSTVSCSLPSREPPSAIASLSSGFALAQKGPVSASHLSMDGLEERCSPRCCLRVIWSLSLLDTSAFGYRVVTAKKRVGETIHNEEIQSWCTVLAMEDACFAGRINHEMNASVHAESGGSSQSSEGQSV